MRHCPFDSESLRVESVLKVIPYDRWVDAAEIAAETGLSSHKVSGIIRRYLLFAYVEGKHRRVYRGSKLYRRLRREVRG